MTPCTITRIAVRVNLSCSCMGSRPAKLPSKVKLWPWLKTAQIIVRSPLTSGGVVNPASGYTIRELAQDLRDFLVALQLHRPILVGWSIGGAIVMKYLIEHQQDVEKAVLVDGAVPRITPAPGFPWGLAEAQLNGIVEGLRDGKTRMPKLRELTNALFSQPDADTTDWLFGISAQASWFIDQAFEDLGRIDYRRYLPMITRRVGVFHGRQDKLVPFDIGKFTADRLPNSRLVVFENSGHAPPLEESKRFNEELLAFLDEP